MNHKRVLKKVFGYDHFRTEQESIIKDIVGGKDVVTIMPTGGGKSLCFQIPAIIKDGVTIVISPLISLMEDQVGALKKQGVKAEYLNSNTPVGNIQSILDSVTNNTLKIIYIAPERIRSSRFRDAVSRSNINMVVVDEAHCISKWGYNFRGDYSTIHYQFKEILGRDFQTVAFTATANNLVQQDIKDRLNLKNPVVYNSGIYRDNLDISVSKDDSTDSKMKEILKIISDYKTGIIYCSTKKDTETVYKGLKDRGFNIEFYHAGVTITEKTRILEGFVDGSIDVVVSTNAFGMGIDRGDVRFVIHWEITSSIESYYQEIGRAGRDGEKSRCHMFYSSRGISTQEWFINNNNPAVDKVLSIHKEYKSLWRNSEFDKKLFKDGITFTGGKKIREKLDIKWGEHQAVDNILKHLGVLVEVGGGYDLKNCEINLKEIEKKRVNSEKIFDDILSYSMNTTCRYKTISNYFNIPMETECGHCDNCNPEIKISHNSE